MRSRVKSVSDRQKLRLALYRKAKAEYLKSHPICEGRPHHDWKRVKATDLHHTRGRAGDLLWDTRHFKALCRECHDWVQSHPIQAREIGLLCPLGLWNTPDRA